MKTKIANYIKKKIEMLRKDFKIRLSKAEIAHFNELVTEAEVDRYAHDIFMRKL